VPSSVDHYAILAVAPDADQATIRAAWIRAARASHPDGRGDRSESERAADERRIRAVNEAWRVLGDVELREEYDRSRRKAEVAHVAPAEGPADFVVGVDEGGGGIVVPNEGVATLLRSLPWLVVGAIGIGIFVFTAFAASNDEPTNSINEPECVRIRDDGTVRPVPCSWDNDGVIDQFVPPDSDEPCRHEHAELHDALAHNARVCLVPLELYD